MDDDAQLFDALLDNQWRLDLNRTLGYRVLYWCAPCQLWRCVDETGKHHRDPRVAIRAAVEANGSDEGRRNE